MEVLQILGLLADILSSGKEWRITVSASIGAALAAPTVIFTPNIPLGIALAIAEVILGFVLGHRWQKHADSQAR